MIREEIVEGLLRPMRALAVPVPPTLAVALGYDQPEGLAARFVAFYWSSNGEELLWDDGANTSTASWLGWHAYFEHPRIRLHALALHRRGYYFGGKGAVATHYFLLDREKRRAYVGNLLDVIRLLSVQHTANGNTPNGSRTPALKENCLQRKTLSQLLDSLNARMEQPDNARLSIAEEKLLPEVRELRRRGLEQKQWAMEMMAWLDKYSPENETFGEVVDEIL